MTDVLVLPLVFGVALLFTYFLVPGVQWIALRFGFVDRPDPRRLPVLKPRLGGVALFLAFSVAVLVSLPLVPSRTEAELGKIMGILVGALVVVVMGIIDDRWELPALPQFLAQFVAATIAILSGVVIDQVNNPLGTPFSPDSMIQFPLVVSFVVSYVWLLGAMNTVNFLDGLDGLAAGIVGIASAVLFLHSFSLNQFSVSLLPLALAGATFGFLRYNFAPAQITMGTSGAVFLGFAIASIAVVGGTKAASLLLVLGIPILDTAWLIIYRLVQRRSPFRADRAHLHHRLMDLGLSQSQIVLVLYALTAVFGSLALIISSRLFKLYVLSGMALVVLAGLVFIAQKSFERRG